MPARLWLVKKKPENFARSSYACSSCFMPSCFLYSLGHEPARASLPLAVGAHPGAPASRGRMTQGVKAQGNKSRALSDHCSAMFNGAAAFVVDASDASTFSIDTVTDHALSSLFPVPLGLEEPRDDYLSRKLSYFEAASFINSQDCPKTRSHLCGGRPTRLLLTMKGPVLVTPVFNQKPSDRLGRRRCIARRSWPRI